MKVLHYSLYIKNCVYEIHLWKNVWLDSKLFHIHTELDT